MSKKFSTTALVLLALAGPVAASCPPALFSEVPRVAALRGLAPNWQPRCELIPTSALEEKLAAKLAKELPLPPEVFLEVLQRLGFVQPTPNLYQRLLDFYGGQVLGYYEPSADTMVVVDRSLPSTVDTTAVWHHELAHAAQETRFHLPTKLLATTNNSDKQRSLSAVAEGEAMLVMLMLAKPSPPPPEELDKAAQSLLEASQASAKGVDLGDFFVEDLIFPYAQGLRTVLSSFKSGGWVGVDRLLRQPPTCTAALLFASPCNHLADTQVPAPPPGWQELLTDTLGAWAVRFWFSQAAQESEAEALARAWDGDRLRLIRHNTSRERWALCWKLRLTNRQKASWAREFLRQQTPKLLAFFRQGGPPAVEVVLEGRTLTVWVDWPAPRP